MKSPTFSVLSCARSLGSFAVVSVLTALSISAHAGGIEQLKAFLAETHAAKATFTQTVVSKSGRKQDSAGSMAFARPGKFRWNYEKPYQQLLVSDGNKLWSYDKDLEQVTIKKIGDALGSTPAALLAGNGDIDKKFTLRDEGEIDGMEVVEALPKDKNSTFAQVRIGFVDKVPKLMQVRDNFGQTTLLSFEHFERNPKIPAATFSFTPPKGVDVIGQ